MDQLTGKNMWLRETVPAREDRKETEREAARVLTRLLNQVGLVPKELWRDRVLHEAQHTADPVHLIRLFGIHPCTAVKHVNAAHPDKALPGTQ